MSSNPDPGPGGAAAIALPLMAPPRDASDGRGASTGGGTALRRHGPAIAIGMVSASALLYLLNTHLGIGLLPDSTRYMQLNDQPYDAPLYAWLLQLAAATGAGLLAGARAIGLALAIANTALIWHLLSRMTGQLAATIVGTALIVFSPQFVTLHATAMSEPLFVFFILTTLLAFLAYLRADGRIWLGACGVSLALCTLTRFAGPPLGLAIATTLLLMPRHPLNRRIADAAIPAIVGGGIFLVWWLLSEAFTGHGLGREMSLAGNMGWPQWLSSMAAMGAWLLPDDAPLSLRIGLLAATIGASGCLLVRHAAVVLRHARFTRVVEPVAPVTLGLFVIFYMAFMVVSTSIEANLSLTGRYAFPAYVGIVLALGGVLATRPKGGVEARARLALIGLAVLVLGCDLARSAVRTHDAYATGIGYTKPEWRRSPTLLAVAALPAGAELWSNGPDAIVAVAGRRAHFIPRHIQLRTGRPDPANPYDRQIAELAGRLQRPPAAYIVFLKGVTWRFYLAEEDELVRALGLRPVLRAVDGSIYTTAARRMPRTPTGEERP